MIKIKLGWQGSLLFLALWLLGASYVFGFWNDLSPNNEWMTITNDLYSFSVDYPTKWTAHTYGESGYRGIKEVKLHIYRSLSGYFVISILQEDTINPSLDDVAAWGQDRIDSINRDIPRSKGAYEESSFSEEQINGEQVLVRRYENKEITNEDVYIAREDDMIMITLQAKTDDFDQYLSDFYRIVASFTSLK